MPNWCQNEITISGDEKKVKEFIKFVSSKKSKFDFNKIYPMPKELEGTVSGSESLKSSILFNTLCSFSLAAWLDASLPAPHKLTKSANPFSKWLSKSTSIFSFFLTASCSNKLTLLEASKLAPIEEITPWNLGSTCCTDSSIKVPN